MRTRWIGRAAATVAVAAAAVAAGGAGASAATHAHATPRTRMAFSPRALAMLSPRAGLLHRLARLLPGTATPSLASLSLFTDPVNLTVNGVSYQMGLSAQTLPAAFDMPPELAVGFDRLAAAHGRFVGEQDHVYGYAPLTGLHLTAGSNLETATLRTGESMLPTRIVMSFHAVGPVDRTSCPLFGGGHGTFQMATGTLTTQTFKFASGTSPFFGTVTTPPTTATIFDDPGCSSVVIDSTARSASAMEARALLPHVTYEQPCDGRETVLHFSLTSFWVDDMGFRGRRLYQLGVTESNPFGPSGVDHLAVGVGAGTDLPHPVLLPGGGIRARVLTRDVPFMGGNAVFKSRAVPRTSAVHACVWEGHTHHFTTRRYAGALTSTSSPLQLLFDTGAQALTPTGATLYVRRYRD